MSAKLEKARQAAENYAKKTFSEVNFGLNFLPEKDFAITSRLIIQELINAWAAGYVFRDEVNE